MKDSIVTVLTPLTTAKECFDTLTNLYEKKIPSQKRVLKTKLRFLKMEKGETISEFFTKISQIRDQLQVAGVRVDEDDLIQTVFDGLPSSWETFLSSVTRRENQPDFQRLWHDCLQEEGRIQIKSGPPKEDHAALATKFSKRKRSFAPKKFQKDKTSAGFKGKKFDISKVRCFSCQKLGHFAKDCRSKKQRGFKGKHHASTTAEGEDESRKSKRTSSPQEKKKDYLLVSALSGNIVNNKDSWLVDSGASRDITGNKEILSDFRKKNFSVQVELGNEASYAIKGTGSVKFQLKCGSMLHLEEVLYVPGLKKNLISVVVLESKGYRVLFMKYGQKMKTSVQHW